MRGSGAVGFAGSIRPAGNRIDYAVLVELYGTSGSSREGPNVYTTTISGNPRKAAVPTSYIERQNLTMRMCMRRFTRKTNAFSEKVEMHAHAVALHFWTLLQLRPIPPNLGHNTGDGGRRDGVDTAARAVQRGNYGVRLQHHQ